MATRKLYGIPNCNTVKKSVDWLKQNAIDFEFHNFKKQGVDASLLRKWFDVFGWEKVINKKGLTFKKLDKETQEKINDPESALQYLMNNSSAIKRPILEVEDKSLLLGFNEEEYSKVLC